MSKNEENAVQEEEQTTSEQVVPETEAAEAAAVEEEVETATRIAGAILRIKPNGGSLASSLMISG